MKTSQLLKYFKFDNIYYTKFNSIHCFDLIYLFFKIKCFILKNKINLNISYSALNLVLLLQKIKML